MQVKRGATKIPVSQVSTTLDGAVQGADQARAAGLAGLQKVRLARAAGMQRERNRLTARYGAADPRAGALARAIEADQALSRRLSLEVTRATAQAPPADPSAWIVFGYVLDANAAGVPGVRVVPCDADGADIQGMKPAATDTTGLFTIRQTVATGASAGAGKAEPSRVDPGRADQGKPDPGKPDAGKTAGGGGVPSRLFLRVDDAGGTTLARDPRPLSPSAGRVDYREITLGDGGAPHGTAQAAPPPPAATGPAMRAPAPKPRRKGKAKPASSP